MPGCHAKYGQVKEMMYAITWNESKTHMVQVGITPKRLLKELKQN